MKRQGTLAVVAVLALTAGCGSSDDTKAKSVSVVMEEFTVQPTPASVAAGKVTFDVANKGKLKHEFVVVATSKQADELLKGDEADETGNAGEIGDLPPGSNKKLSITLKAGHYVLLCNLPGHYKAGQRTDFTVN